MANIEKKESVSIRTRQRDNTKRGKSKVYTTKNYNKLFGGATKSKFTVSEDLISDLS
jgi:hypothetical protein